MGDTTDRFAHFMLIGATTEDPAESLLSTFKRRMPLTIEIPSLSERPINERLDIISLFLAEKQITFVSLSEFPVLRCGFDIMQREK